MARPNPVPAPTRGRLHLLLLMAALLALLAPSPVYSHGSLTSPRSRNVISPINGETWWKDHGNGHGAAVVKPLNGPGVCGAPYQHDADGNRYTAAGSSQGTYSAGGIINVQWWLQVNHGGRIGVKLCPRRDISQGCFDQYQLQRADGQGPYVYILDGPSLGQQSRGFDFRLPAGVSCTGGCVLQWEYLTMNSCFEPCPNRNACGPYADRRNPVTGQANMGTCCLGGGCSAANAPEVFRNCADITINGGGPTPPGPTPPGPTPPGGCAKCNAPASQGGCKCDSNCNCLPGPGPTPPGPTPPPAGGCARCNLAAWQGGCKCDSNCGCLPGTGGSPCDKCNIDVSNGGCKCDSSCNCLPRSMSARAANATAAAARRASRRARAGVTSVPAQTAEEAAAVAEAAPAAADAAQLAGAIDGIAAAAAAATVAPAVESPAPGDIAATAVVSPAPAAAEGVQAAEPAAAAAAAAAAALADAAAATDAAVATEAGDAVADPAPAAAAP